MFPDLVNRRKQKPTEWSEESRKAFTSYKMRHTHPGHPLVFIPFTLLERYNAWKSIRQLAIMRTKAHALRMLKQKKRRASVPDDISDTSQFICDIRKTNAYLFKLLWLSFLLRRPRSFLIEKPVYGYFYHLTYIWVNDPRVRYCISGIFM